MRVFSKLLLLVATAAAAACSNESGPNSEPHASVIAPTFDTVDVPSATVEIAGRVERLPPQTRAVARFRITRTVITEPQWSACAEAGICTPLSHSDDAEGSEAPAPRDGVPVFGVSPEQANEFCESWAGGSLPTAGQWLLGARGAQKRSYPWAGDSPPSCAQNGRANRRCCERAKNCDALTRGQVLKHPDGASPYGMEDVLITGTELLARDDTARCRGRGCYVRGDAPSRIDVVAPHPRDGELRYAAGFRCAWDE